MTPHSTAPRSHRTPTGHAVVIGGGMAGLLTTRVLADFFDQVTVLERAPAASGDRWRSGAPQARHPHLLLARGRLILEGLFPGLHDDLRLAGTPVFDFGQRAAILTPAGPTPTVSTGIICQSSSRPLLESLLHARVQALPGVTIRHSTTVTGLRFNPATTAVTGVTHTRRGTPAASNRVSTELEADLVVDASGRSSRLPDWLAEHGLPRPRTTTVDPRIGYATRRYTIPDTLTLDVDFLAELTRAPHRSRGCFGLRIEDNQFLLGLQGAGGDYPPHTEQEFAEFAASLHIGLPALLEHLTPSSPIYGHRDAPNRRHHYERLRPWPTGLVVLGDAACVFNPVYAQGITVAALHALALRDLLTRTHPADRTTALAAFQRRQARITAWPWLLSTCLDHAWQPQPPTLTDKVTARVLDALLNSLPGSPAMFTRFFRVLHMLTGPHTFLHPAALARTATHLRHRPPAAQREPTAVAVQPTRRPAPRHGTQQPPDMGAPR
ncbi:NAD(P)/FAD-dependent oxidoreductase [Streptomyces sp. CBMA152]|uniref:FAD-dependent oxidoreductase n=1 Tax=Streptomyces sp. CBMA152 TaxID=1896312 RepID=UPI00166152AB|nr:monooxygenase [Streptomyces sp. CBMA152]MBD0746748.1 hypothetical protein [Streptomyces sp. CBMA152]